MKKGLILFICFAISSNLWSQKSYSIGEIHTIQSKELNEERTLNIHLPLNFSKDSVYPVMYVLDGSAHEDFLHIVGLVQYFQLQFTMPDIIVVGIENVDRKRDFTFHTDIKELQTDFPTTGHSAKFIQFMEKELQPYIERKFKTNDNKYLIGQSLGGLLATEVLLNKPDLFSHYLIVSPSLWWDDQSLLETATESIRNKVKNKTYVSISVGAKEHRIMQKDAKTLKKDINKAKNDQITLDFNFMKKEDHASILHNALYQALEKMFPLK